MLKGTPVKFLILNNSLPTATFGDDFGEVQRFNPPKSPSFGSFEKAWGKKKQGVFLGGLTSKIQGPQNLSSKYVKKQIPGGFGGEDWEVLGVKIGRFGW